MATDILEIYQIIINAVIEKAIKWFKFTLL